MLAMSRFCKRSLYLVLSRLHCCHRDITNVIYQTGGMGPLLFTVSVPYAHHFPAGISPVYCLFYGNEILV